ncbi:MAG: MBL fold metallo-hydrolase [Deltaproteobacteria bacterium]|nr:MAG: MBL fold metallo-hydrolase [Deltaproteobacteria bacterium]
MELRELARDVYACLQPDRGLGTSNSGLLNRGGGLVVDTFWDLPHTRQMIDTYARVWKAPARRVVNTHRNGDHCWGHQLFPDAEIIGHRLCAAEFGKERPEFMQTLRNSGSSSDPALAAFARRLADWDFAGIELRPPKTLIDERLTLDLDGIHADLIYVGPAHTAGDLIVHLPAERIVFTGDILFRLCTPIGWEGTYDRWIAALDRIVALAPDVVVPGHGPVCGLEGPREMKAYLQYVRAESKRLFDRGLSAVDAAKRIDLGPYAGWTEPERIVFQVERAYRELRGEPFDAPIDVTPLFGAMHELAREQRH